MWNLFRKRRNVINPAGAFDRDGYEVKETITRFNRTGIMAEHKTAFNYETGQKKKAYYLEGTNYEMGYLLGCLAENEVSSMANDFTDKIVFAFIGSEVLDKIKLLQEVLVFIIYEFAKGIYSDLPREIRDEIQGICDGCRAGNSYTKVNMERLIALNVGIDIICSRIYMGNFLPRKIPRLLPYDFKIPIMCNAFSIFGEAAGNGHYFGRDFMFPTADVFQNTAAMLIYNPASTAGKKAYPFVSVTAPGMVGSISAMNMNGVGIGVDMSPAANCDPLKIGTNSLLLTHLCAQFGGSSEQMLEIMIETPRGVSWNYIIADGTEDRACIVEAGRTDDNPDFMKYPPENLKSFLPDSDHIYNYKSAEYQKGLMVRWNDYKYPVEYLDYNNGLWEHYNKKHFSDKQLYPNAFTRYGYINRNHTEKNCPSTFYFAPQRENNDNLVIATNHFIIPEMRFYTMHPWTSLVVGDRINDIQWRYDELNNQILTALKIKGGIDYETAKKLIDYLAPYGKIPSYYSGNPKSHDGREIRIEGCTSIFDLKKKIVESHFGYYCDEWTKITLPYYIDQTL